MKIAVYDIETNGFDPETCDVLEFAYVIVDWNEMKPYKVVSSFCQLNTSREIPDEIIELTGITERHLLSADTFVNVFKKFNYSLDYFGVQFLFAHNGKFFDAPFIKRKLEMCGYPPSEFTFDKLMQIDTCSDYNWPYASKKLTYLAAELGFLNPFPHDALADCMTTLKVARSVPLETWHERAMSPDCYIRANVHYADRDKAKEAGYRWQTVNDRTYNKMWVKCVKKLDLEKEIALRDFPVEVLDNGESEASS